MSTFNWESFLRQWSHELIESLQEERYRLPQEVIESNWLGYPGATEEQINCAESRLKVKLPPSYREFLKVSNGWRQTTPFIERLWSTEELEWFPLRHQAWIDNFISGYLTTNYRNITANGSEDRRIIPFVSDAEYFTYGETQDCSKLRLEYLQTVLEISQEGDSAIYLLNPQVINTEGEWEAWFFANWLPGADRYPSFYEMMQAEYINFLELREN